MAREHPFEGNYGASTNKHAKRNRYENEQSEMANGTRGLCLSLRALANWI